jgi:hypothetical protein
MKKETRGRPRSKVPLHPKAVDYRHWRLVVNGKARLSFTKAEMLALEMPIDVTSIMRLVTPPSPQKGALLEKHFRSMYDSEAA